MLLILTPAWFGNVFDLAAGLWELSWGMVFVVHDFSFRLWSGVVIVNEFYYELNSEKCFFRLFLSFSKI